MRRILTLSAALSIALASGVSAQVERSHVAHVHGRTQIDLVYEAGTLQLALNAPGMDLAGFEHAPADEAQAATIAAVVATLEDSAAWLRFEPDGRCTVTTATAGSQGFGKAHAESQRHDSAAPLDGHDGHDPEHDDGDLDHDQNGTGLAGHGHAEDPEHAGFHLTLTARCDEAPEALAISLHDRFPSLDRVRVDLVTDTAQNRVELGRGQTRVPLAD